MYFFVRLAAITLMIFGVLFMFGGIGVAIYGLVQNDAVTAAANAMLEGSNLRMVNAGVAAALVGVILFFKGMLVAAIGQMMMAFIDIANNTRETNLILRAFRRQEE